MIKNKNTYNLNNVKIKKNNLKNVKIKKKNLKNANLKKGGFLGFNNYEKGFINKYISEEEKGFISLYFSTSSILKKIEISKKINEKLIKLIKAYYQTESPRDSTNINIYINEISTENLRLFTQKTIDTRDFITTDFLNINLKNVFHFFDSNIASTKCKNNFIEVYYKIATRYIGDKYFKIHEKYNNLLKYDKNFFEQIINFINNINSAYLFNINIIIIILYTYTDTRNLQKSENIYFPKNYYEIIIKSFFEYIKNYGYPPMNKDYYYILSLLPKSDVDKLNKFDPSIKLSNIITHPSYHSSPSSSTKYYSRNRHPNGMEFEQNHSPQIPSNSPNIGTRPTNGLGYDPNFQNPSPQIPSNSPNIGTGPTNGLGYDPNFQNQSPQIPSNSPNIGTGHTNGLGYDTNFQNPSPQIPSNSPNIGTGPINGLAYDSQFKNTSQQIPRNSPNTRTTPSNSLGHDNNFQNPSLINSLHFDLDSNNGLNSQLDSIVFDSNTSTDSNFFASKGDLKKSPSDYKGFLNLLKLINDNNEYGYRWKKLTCSVDDFNKYGCNNLNYDLNDLKHNNIIIKNCNSDLECQEYNKINDKFYKHYIRSISNVNDNYIYPEDQIKQEYNNEEFKKISELILNTKYKNIFDDVIIIDSQSIFVAYNKFKKYELSFKDSNIYIELSSQNKILLEKLSTASLSAYGTIYKASLDKYNFATKLSLCDDVNNLNYKLFNQSNLKEIHLFDIVTKYAITKININLPIIYKTIQLNISRIGIAKIFGDEAWRSYSKHNKGCKLGSEPSINCSIVELYSGDCNKYVLDFYKNDNIDYFKYLLSGFENIIISILSFWSVTKCIHNDAHMGNFLYKLTNDKHRFNKYNIQGKSFYISTYTKCNWTLWDYGSCMPFLYQNYFEKNSDIIFYQDDIRRSVFLYCLKILNPVICTDYTKNLYNKFNPSNLILNKFHYKIIELIIIYIINELLNEKKSKPYYNNIYYYNLFFDKMLYYIYNLKEITIDSSIQSKLIEVFKNMNKTRNYNINNQLNFIFTAFKNPSDSTIKKFVSDKIYNKIDKNELKKFFYQESLICLICCKFITIYLKKKEKYKSTIKNESFIKNHNFTNNVISMVIDTILSFKKEKFLEYLNSNELFSRYIDESTYIISKKDYYIGNNIIGYHWIKVNNIDSKMVKPLKTCVTTKVYKCFIKYFIDNYKDNSNIVIIDEIKNNDMKPIFDFLNNFSSSRGFFRTTNPSYFYDYYIEFDKQFFVTYNDIDYQLYKYNTK